MPAGSPAPTFLILAEPFPGISDKGTRGGEQRAGGDAEPTGRGGPSGAGHVPVRDAGARSASGGAVTESGTDARRWKKSGEVVFA